MPSNAPPKTSANVTNATVSAVMANYSLAPLAACSSGPSVSCGPVGGHDDTQFYVRSDDCAMSALPPKADIRGCGWECPLSAKSRPNENMIAVSTALY